MNEGQLEQAAALQGGVIATMNLDP